MSGSVTDWAANKLAGSGEGVQIVGRTPEDFLLVRAADAFIFPVAVLGLRNVIGLSDVEPLFTGATKPRLVVNIPSRTLWSGAAIDYIHARSSAFGTLGDVSRAAQTGSAGSFRDKNMGFFINAMKQHSNVSSVSYVYDCVFRVERKRGASIVVAVVDAYNLSAEDVRNANSRLGSL